MVAPAKSKTVPKTVTGIEFGNRVVRVATVSVGRQGQIVLRALSQAVVPVSRAGLADEVRAGRVSALKDALSKHPKDLGAVIVGIPRDDVISRMVSLPSTQPEELHEMLFFDVDRYLPFPPEEGEVSYRVVEQVGASESRVLMVAAKKDCLYAVLDDLDEIGVEPQRLDVDTHGASYIHCHQENGEETSAFFHLDLQKSLIGLSVENQLRFSRTTSDGVEGLGKEWMECSFEGNTEDWPEDHRTWWEGLIRSLKRSMAGFAHEKMGGAPEKLFLAGPGSQIEGIPAALERELGLPVNTDPLMDPGKVTESIPEFATAIGLALGQIDDPRPINLVPEEIYQKRSTARRKQFLLNSATLLVVNLLLAGLWVGHAFWDKQQRIDVYSAKIKAILPEVEGIREIADKLDTIDKNIDTENSAFKVVHDLFMRTNDRVRISQLTFEKSDSLEMNLETYENRDLDQYISQLAESPHLCGTIERGRSNNQPLPPGQFAVERFLKVSGLRGMLCSNEKLQE